MHLLRKSKCWRRNGIIGIRDLKNRASEIVRKVKEEQAPYIITLRGKPSAMIIPLEENEVEDYIIAHHP